MLQQHDLQLHHVRQEISRQVAFPEELSVSLNEQAAQELLDEVTACETPDDLLKLTYSLSRKRLNDLFGAVLVLSAAVGEEPVNRLLEIFRKRATLSLAQIAWAYYQRHYPNDRLCRVLSTVVRGLPAKEEKQPFLEELRQVAIDQHLPKRLAERLTKEATGKEKGKLPLREAGQTTDNSSSVTQLKEKYPMLAAYTSLTNLPEENTDASCLDSGLCGYMVRLTILPDTPFAAAFLTAYLQSAADQEILINGDLFMQALRLDKQPAQLILLQRYLREYRLGKSWDSINAAILELFGAPPDTVKAPVQAKAAGPAEKPAREQQQVNSAVNHADPFAPKRPANSPDLLTPKQPAGSPDLFTPKQPERAPLPPAAAADDEKAAERNSGLGGWLKRRRDRKVSQQSDAAPASAASPAASPLPAGQPPAWKPAPVQGWPARQEDIWPEHNEMPSIYGKPDPFGIKTPPVRQAAPGARRAPEPPMATEQPKAAEPVKAAEPTKIAESPKAAELPKAPEPINEPGTARAADAARSEAAGQVLAELQQALFAGIQNPQEDAGSQAQPAEEKPIWSLVDAQSVNRFRQWAYMHQLSWHCGENQRKMLFYQRYALDIQKVNRWDDHTMVVQFPDFVIADQNDDEDCVWYYDQNTYHMLAERQHGRPALNRPDQPWISSRDAMLQDSRNNIVCLRLDSVNLLYSHDFIQRIRTADNTKP